MQAWFAVHGPLLRRAAAKDSLWHRVLSGLVPPTAGDIAKGMVQKSGNAKIVMRQAFRTFRGQCHKVPCSECHAITPAQSCSFTALHQSSSQSPHCKDTRLVMCIQEARSGC